MKQIAVWIKENDLGAEWAEVTLRPASLEARGLVIGGRPLPHRIEYELLTGEGFATALLVAEARGAGWRRSIELARSASGRWSCRAEADGGPDLGEPGGEVTGLDPALDCDLGLSPLTNTMPVLRHRLLEEPGVADLVMAWVAVPQLSVEVSRQRYTHLSRGVVRYESGAFAADLSFDAHGLVSRYPGLARRV